VQRVCIIVGMDLDKLRTLVELSRRGTMSAVAEATGYGTSAVSQQLAALERQAKVPLLEASGRRVRLTPAGRRLVAHAERILAAVTAAELDLSAAAEPSGLVRVAGYTTALRAHLVPVAAELARDHPQLELEIQEHEPDEVDELLDNDLVDLGLIYDYTLVPRGGRGVCTLLSTVEMKLAFHPDLDVPQRIRTPEDLAAVRHADWIGNSRDSADDELAARLCALAGWQPRVRHRADSLDLVVDLVFATRGVCLLAEDAAESRRLRTVSIDFARTDRRMWSVVRDGAQDWPATRTVIDAVRRHANPSAAAPV
jgi:DNA-binding transcriptional LysR family regulator